MGIVDAIQDKLFGNTYGMVGHSINRNLGTAIFEGTRVLYMRVIGSRYYPSSQEQVIMQVFQDGTMVYWPNIYRFTRRTRNAISDSIYAKYDLVTELSDRWNVEYQLVYQRKPCNTYLPMSSDSDSVLIARTI